MFLAVFLFFASLWRKMRCLKSLRSLMYMKCLGIASSISWIVTPNTLFLSGCFHHLLYTVASSILQFATILCPPSLARMRHRCRHRLSSIFGFSTVRPMTNGVGCLYPTYVRRGNISMWKPIHPAYTKPIPSVSCSSTAFLYHLR